MARPNLKLVCVNKNNDPKASMLRRRQRQLAWALYYGEGFRANLLKQLDSNSFALFEADLTVLQKSAEDIERTLARLRKHITRTT